MQPENKAAPSGARLSDCSSVCHHSSCHCCHVGNDDAWILWPRSRLSEHLQTHVSLDVRMDLGYSVTDTPACPRHIPVSTMSQPGEAKTSLSSQVVMLGREGGGRGGGYRSGSRATPSIFGFGSCTCPPIDVYLFMMQWKQRFKSAVPAAKDTFNCSCTLTKIQLHVCLGNLAIVQSIVFSTDFNVKVTWDI